MKAKVPEELKGTVWEDTPCWSGVGEGWWSLLTEANERLCSWRGLNNPFKVDQFKEKFGELRIYIDYLGNSDFYEEGEKIINEITSRSRETCETCGEYAEVTARDGHWLKARCDKH